MQIIPWENEHSRLLDKFGLKDLDLSSAVALRFNPGETIIREGFPLEYLFFVVSGKAKVYTTAPNGKSLLLYNYIARGLIGDVELMTESLTASTTMQSITEFVCVALPFEIYGESLRKNLEFVNKVGQELAVKLLRNSKNNAITILHSGKQRLKAYILQTSQDNLFTDKLTDVADFIGVSYRHLLRMLKDLTAQKILKKQPKGYLILDKERLTQCTLELYLE